MFLYASTLGVLFLLFWLITYMQESYYRFPTYNMTPSLYFQYYIWQFPKYISQLTPFAAQIAIVLLTWRMQSHREITGLMNVGLSPSKILAPLWQIAWVIMLGTFLLNELFLPTCIQNFNTVFYSKMQSRLSETKLTLENQWFLFHDTKTRMQYTVYFQNQQPNRLQSVSIFATNETNSNNSQATPTQSIYQASYATWQKQHWVFHDTIEYSFVGTQWHTKQYLPVWDSPIMVKPTLTVKPTADFYGLSLFFLASIIQNNNANNADNQTNYINAWSKILLGLYPFLAIMLCFPILFVEERQTPWKATSVAILGHLLFWLVSQSLLASSLNNPNIVWYMNPLVDIILLFLLLWFAKFYI
jgi:lipopolysaccharide export LptBFGC system permease protein LptF